MRSLYLTPVIVLGLGLTSCNRDNNRTSRHEPTAREAGREAYKASQDVKRGAKEAAKKLQNAGKEFRQGWSDAKHQDPKQRDKR